MAYRGGDILEDGFSISLTVSINIDGLTGGLLWPRLLWPRLLWPRLFGPRCRCVIVLWMVTLREDSELLSISLAVCINIDGLTGPPWRPSEGILWTVRVLVILREDSELLSISLAVCINIDRLTRTIWNEENEEWALFMYWWPSVISITSSQNRYDLRALELQNEIETITPDGQRYVMNRRENYTRREDTRLRQLCKGRQWPQENGWRA